MTATLTRLQPGMRLMHGGVPHRVVMVNECRALIEPVSATVRTIRPHTGPHAGRDIQIRTHGPRVSISPNSECEIL